MPSRLRPVTIASTSASSSHEYRSGRRPVYVAGFEAVVVALIMLGVVLPIQIVPSHQRQGPLDAPLASRASGLPSGGPNNWLPNHWWGFH
jgi:hypothetical protein